MEKTIYTLELHETLRVSPVLSIMRVAGGWIYSDERADTVPVNNFVPFDNEFQEVPKVN